MVVKYHNTNSGWSDSIALEMAKRNKLLATALGSAPSDCLSAYSCYMQHVQNDKRVWVCSGKTRRLGNKQPSGPFNYRVRLWKKWWYPVVPQLDLGAVLSIIRAVHTNCAVLLDQS